MDHARGWVQQFHLGAMRNTSTRAMRVLGPDTGYDSIGDFPQGEALARFLDRLDAEGHLAKTILYNLNPRDNELLTTMIGNFQDGSVPGKMQFGSAWWFLDQLDGMEKQMNALSNMGLLSRFVGMLTDSRSFLSYSRHDYFRRLLCNLLGNDVEAGPPAAPTARCWASWSKTSASETRAPTSASTSSRQRLEGRQALRRHLHRLADRERRVAFVEE